MAKRPMRSALGRAIGLGSAKAGVDHWWLQRVTALALVPLALWFVIAVVALAGADRAALLEWLRRPLPAVLMIMLLVATFYHGALGLQVVIEDYVSHEGTRFALLIANKLVAILFAALGVFAVLKLALGA
jgi:succinate dehydrogenase / fumarate reductase membrane anchor subunit